MAKGTVVRRGNKGVPQVRKERKDAFSAAKKQIFLDHYAAGCNVTPGGGGGGGFDGDGELSPAQRSGVRAAMRRGAGHGL